jgi:integrase
MSRRAQPGLYQLGPTKWKKVVYAGLDRPGGSVRQRTKTFEAATRAAAERIGIQFQAEVQAEVEERREQRGTMNELLDDWLKHRDEIDSPSTVRGRAALVERIRARFGTQRLADITARDLDTWYSDLRAEGLRPTTIANAHGQLRAIMRQGEKWQLCDASVMDRASPPSRRYPQRQAISMGALDVLLADASLDLRLCAEVLRSTGLRRGELLALRFSDVRTDHRTGVVFLSITKAMIVDPAGRAQVSTTKTDRIRQVPIDEALYDMIWNHQRDLARAASSMRAELHPDPYVIADMATNPSGTTPRKPNWLTLAWSRHCARHGVKMRVHDLRHWHASFLIDNGVPASEVAARLGHASVKMTLDTYTHQVMGSPMATIAAQIVGERRALPAP